jgi:hypothetical protein
VVEMLILGVGFYYRTDGEREKKTLVARKAIYPFWYMAIFAYPVLAVKIVDLFGCTEIEGAYYLRSDFSIQCYTTEWNLWAAYAGCWLAIYVIGLPLFIIFKLWVGA